MLHSGYVIIRIELGRGGGGGVVGEGWWGGE